MDIFEKSVPMSTYLVAFVISKFKSISKNSPKHNILIEVSARPSAIDNGEAEYALEYVSMFFIFSYRVKSL